MSDRSLLTTGTILSLLLATGAKAQIIPDNTLPNNTIVAPNGQTINIEGGTRSGGNLFHSFLEFNLGAGSTAFFNNAVDIQNILSRVTGGNISNIDGLIRANGAANLFFVNPAGIVFGPNARLNIGGSFLATTADSVIFDNGSFFSATTPNAPPLLTVNVPVGLQMGPNPGAMVVRGPGHQITRENDFAPHNRLPVAALPVAPGAAIPPEGFPQQDVSTLATAGGTGQPIAGLPIASGAIPPEGFSQLPPTTGQQGLPPTAAIALIFSQLPPIGLQLSPGNTLALVGGDVLIEGGILTAYEGRIELGSVKEGNVSINPLSDPALGWNLGYEGATQFGDILMKKRSLVDASSLLRGGGSIQVQGQNLEMRDVSGIFIQNLGLQRSGNIDIHAVESVILSDTDANTKARTIITEDSLGSGDNGDVNIFTSRLLLSDGSAIANNTYGQSIGSAGTGGDINIKAIDSVEVVGVSPFNPEQSTAIAAGTLGGANAGKLTLSTGQLRIVDGGSITSTTVGSGLGGEVNINATNFVEIAGVEASNFLPSNLSVFAAAEGAAGNLRVNAPRLIVNGGGRVSATTVSSGRAGSITIDASESVEVSGRVSGSVNPSIIDSSADIFDESLQTIGVLSPVPTGDTGELTVNAPRLRVTDGAQIGVQHEGTGNAGALRINADSVLVAGGGSITAGSASGFGGNVVLKVGDSLLLRDGGNITAEAGGAGDGGNLTINAETIALLRDSNINANAFEGTGGNIRITTEGLFPSADSAITASSQLGVDGTVEVEGLDNEATGLVQLSNNLPELTALIANGCEEFANSEFIITGRGGLSPNPLERISLVNPQVEWAVPEGSLQSSDSLEVGTRWPTFPRQGHLTANTQLVEAAGWVRRPDGGIELVANTGGIQSSWHRWPECGNN